MEFKWLNKSLINQAEDRIEILAQTPVGNGNIRVYENLSIGKKTVKNIQAGK